jgi:hypothetical protein
VAGPLPGMRRDGAAVWRRGLLHAGAGGDGQRFAGDRAGGRPHRRVRARPGPLAGAGAGAAQAGQPRRSVAHRQHAVHAETRPGGAARPAAGGRPRRRGPGFPRPRRQRRGQALLVGCGGGAVRRSAAGDRGRSAPLRPPRRGAVPAGGRGHGAAPGDAGLAGQRPAGRAAGRLVAGHVAGPASTCWPTAGCTATARCWPNG